MCCDRRVDDQQLIAIAKKMHSSYVHACTAAEERDLGHDIVCHIR